MYIRLNARGTRIVITQEIGYKISDQLGGFMKKYKGQPDEEILINYSRYTVDEVLDSINTEVFKQFIKLRLNPDAKNSSIHTVLREPNKVLLELNQISIRELAIEKTNTSFSVRTSETYGNTQLHVKVGNVSKIWYLQCNDYRPNIYIKLAYPRLGNNAQTEVNITTNEQKLSVNDNSILKRYVHWVLTTFPEALAEFFELDG